MRKESSWWVCKEHRVNKVHYQKYMPESKTIRIFFSKFFGICSRECCRQEYEKSSNDIQDNHSAFQKGLYYDFIMASWLTMIEEIIKGGILEFWKSLSLYLSMGARQEICCSSLKKSPRGGEALRQKSPWTVRTRSCHPKPLTWGTSFNPLCAENRTYFEPKHLEFLPSYL